MNDTIFKDINTEEKSYLIGFLLADGCIGKSDNSIRLQLQSRDEDILLKFKKILNVHSNITTRFIKNNSYKGLRFCSHRIKTDLINVGITPLKTRIGTWPKIPEYLFWHFFRGFSDGDGCIYFSNEKNIGSWNLVCHENISDNIIQIIDSTLKIHVTIRPHHRTSYIKILSINGNQNLFIFLNKLYENSTIFLNRKYNKYIQFKTYYEHYLQMSVSKKPIGIEKTSSGKFAARIKHNNIRYYLGSFDTIEEASLQYDTKLIELSNGRCITNKHIASFSNKS